MLARGQGEICENLFDCFGNMLCCPGIGPMGHSLCYPECSHKYSNYCNEIQRCAHGLVCCHNMCYTLDERTEHCETMEEFKAKILHEQEEAARH